MAREFFKNLPDTTTPLTAPRLNGLLDGDEAMGNIVVDSIRGKNLFNEAQLFQANDWTINSSGYYNGTLSNFNTRFTNGFMFDKPFKSNTQYTFSANGYVSGGTCLIVFVYSDNSYDNLTITQTSTTNLTFTTPSNKTLSKIRGTYSSGGSNTFYIKNIQLEEGTTNTDYTEYQGLGLGYVSGQNSNGSYVKYDDGRLECYADKEFTGLNFTASGSLYKCDISSPFTFPIAFISAPTISIQTQSANDYSYSFVYAFRKSTTAITTLELMRVVSASNASVPIGYIAKGRWK